MAYILPEVILEAKQIDLLTYLKAYEPDELVRFSRSSITKGTGKEFIETKKGSSQGFLFR